MKARTLDGANVNKYVRPTIVRLNKAKAFLAVEPLHDTRPGEMSGEGRYRSRLYRASTECILRSGAQLLKCRAFQTVEVAFAGRRLLQDMLRLFERCDRLSD